MPLSEPQRKVILSDKRFRVLLSGRRFGKTFVALNELAKFGQYSNKKIFYISPSYRQSKEIMWKPLKEKINESVATKATTKLLMLLFWPPASAIEHSAFSNPTMRSMRNLKSSDDTLSN